MGVRRISPIGKEKGDWNLQDWKLTDNQKFGGGHCKTGNWWTRSQGWTLQDSSPAMTDKGGAENLWLAGLGVQGRSPGRGSGGLRSPEAEALSEK